MQNQISIISMSILIHERNFIKNFQRIIEIMHLSVIFAKKDRLRISSSILPYECINI